MGKRGRPEKLLTQLEQHKEELIMLYAAGLSLRKLATRYGVSHKTIARFIERENYVRSH